MMVRGIALVVALLAAAPSASAEPPAAKSDVLDLLEGALSAGEGVPARALLDRYLEENGPSRRTPELEILTDYYNGEYEAAAEGVLALRKDPRAPADLGSFADVIVDTFETTKGYEIVRHGNFEVRYQPGPDEILVPYALDTLKAATDALEQELGVRMVSPIRLEIYPDADSLARVSTLSVEAIRTTGTIALCKWGRLMIASPRALMHGYPWLDTIAHEYVHLLLTKATLDRAPVWLQEGVAKFLESRWRQSEAELAREPASERLLYEAAMKSELLDFDQLHPSIALLPTQKDASLAFAQVSSFIASFYESFGAEGLQTVLDHVADGEDARKAFSKVARVPWRTLEGRWRDELAEAPEAPDARLIPRYLKGEASEQDEVASVEIEQARKFLRLGDMLWARQRPAAASIEYGKAHRASPGDPVVASRYARSAIAGGRPQDAIVPLTTTLALYPNHAPALSSLATAQYRTRALEEAEKAANRAIAHNPFDPQPHCVLSVLRVPQAQHEASLCQKLGGFRE
jgi:tetratricopeptide (TPR) repeat protein